jgi:hypothetical protein
VECDKERSAPIGRIDRKQRRKKKGRNKNKKQTKREERETTDPRYRLFEKL